MEVVLVSTAFAMFGLPTYLNIPELVWLKTCPRPIPPSPALYSEDHQRNVPY